MFKKILFATSGSPACDNAARVAFDMAKRYDLTENDVRAQMDL